MSSTNITLTSGLELTSSLESGGSSVSTVAAAITYQTELSVSPSSCALECSIFDPASSNTESSASETPSTSSSSPAEPQPTSGTTGVSGGAVAGVAAGCLIAGTLIALIACFFLYRRQNRKRPVARPQLHPAYDSENKFGAAVLISPGLGAIRNPERTLPQPVEDAAITKEVSKIRDNIKNHVQTYYHFQPGPGGIQSSDLAALATATNLNETVIEAMLVGTSMRGDAIRLFIAWAILSRCETGRHPTLLPLGLESILETMARKNLRGSDESAWFSQWKVLTGALIGQQDGEVTSVSASNAIVEAMDIVLGPFVQPRADGDKRRRNLDMILARATKLAFLLFSQPGSFHFDFSGSQQGGVVAFPGLVQVVGDEGQVLSQPRVIWPKEVATD